MLLVTGANGFVGSAVVAELVRRGWPVRAAVRGSGKMAALPDSVEVVVADVEDEGSLRAAAVRGPGARGGRGRAGHRDRQPGQHLRAQSTRPHSYNALLRAVLDGQVREIVDARISWVLAQDVAIGHALAFERGRSGHRCILFGEVASFATVLNTCAELAGSPHRVRALPPGGVVGDGAPLFAQRSQMFGMLAHSGSTTPRLARWGSRHGASMRACG